MTRRRHFFRLAAETTAVAMLPASRIASAEQIQPGRIIHRGKPLLDLQQQSVDLRFGMFLHFNMATFQDRE